MTEASAAVAFDCARLRSLALQEAHAEWLPELSAALIAQMRASPLGLRMLARALAEGPAVELFAVPLWHMPAHAEWLFWPRPALDEAALDLAALALSGSIRGTVRRDAVLRLKRVLGEVRYALALSEPPGDTYPAGFADALVADKPLERYFFAHGYAELIGHAGALHAACAERIRVSLPPKKVPSLPHRLDFARAAAHLDGLLAAADQAPAETEERVANG
ncbi:MAG: hypothetical protein J0I77_17145 [Rudaea sp.]|uniref:hypothetical protein n=1 Tax=unclassified Rudaea TaxID=2627037 RepID=UPI0010F91B51|nr:MULTISPECIES: hypothetical protein [unclassified Rudaea]MBN8887453.1 hypothetical protein [Rudaea sp.]MBR0345093.1 hypothetical protein [Rudaea sp.]